MHYTNTNNPADFPQSKIIELWGEALDRAASETYTQLSYSQVLKVKQVFADLIVRECADVCQSFGESGDGFTCSAEILEHFGVEE